MTSTVCAMVFEEPNATIARRVAIAIISLGISCRKRLGQQSIRRYIAAGKEIWTRTWTHVKAKRTDNVDIAQNEKMGERW